MSIREFISTLFQIEKELNLFEKQIMGVYFWKLLRFNIFMTLTRDLGLYEQAHIEVNIKDQERKNHDIENTFNANNHSYTVRKNPVDVLIFEHPRKIKTDGIYKDIYTYTKVLHLQNNNISYEIVDRPYLLQHYELPSEKRSYFEDYSDKYKELRKEFKLDLNKTDLYLIKRIEQKVYEALNVKLRITTLTESAIRGFLIRKSIIKDALSRRHVKKIYLVVSYGLEPIIAAAQELDIECIEIQHGTMSYYHPGYSFPFNKKIPYFPNKIEIFGEYWKDITPLPLPNENCVTVGYPYLCDQLRNFQHLVRDERKVTFLSQGTIGKDLSSFAYHFAINHPNLHIFYKMHPGEFDRWEGSYSDLSKAKDLPNFNVIQNEKNLYELLLTSKYVFGVYSTALYEALEVGCKIFLLDLPGIEHCNDLISRNFAVRLHPTNFMKINMQNYIIKKPYAGYFFDRDPFLNVSTVDMSSAH